jgi:hypothetical protein
VHHALANHPCNVSEEEERRRRRRASPADTHAPSPSLSFSPSLSLSSPLLSLIFYSSLFFPSMGRGKERQGREGSGGFATCLHSVGCAGCEGASCLYVHTKKKLPSTHRFPFPLSRSRGTTSSSTTSFIALYFNNPPPPTVFIDWKRIFNKKLGCTCTVSHLNLVCVAI